MADFIDDKIAGIYFSPWKKDYGKTLLELYHKLIYLKSNPRDETYMRKIFLEKFPVGRFIYTTSVADIPSELITSADILVMLYPDAIGIGFARLESVLMKKKKKSARLYVLNGRRRLFEFTSFTGRALKIRRFMETFLAGEILACILFVVITPIFIFIDFLRGKR